MALPCSAGDRSRCRVGDQPHPDLGRLAAEGYDQRYCDGICQRKRDHSLCFSFFRGHRLALRLGDDQ